MRGPFLERQSGAAWHRCLTLWLKLWVRLLHSIAACQTGIQQHSPLPGIWAPCCKARVIQLNQLNPESKIWNDIWNMVFLKGNLEGEWANINSLCAYKLCRTGIWNLESGLKDQEYSVNMLKFVLMRLYPCSTKTRDGFPNTSQVLVDVRQRPTRILDPGNSREN